VNGWIVVTETIRNTLAVEIAKHLEVGAGIVACDAARDRINVQLQFL
jgi:hypothetical protein